MLDQVRIDGVVTDLRGELPDDGNFLAGCTIHRIPVDHATSAIGRVLLDHVYENGYSSLQPDEDYEVIKRGLDFLATLCGCLSWLLGGGDSAGYPRPSHLQAAEHGLSLPVLHRLQVSQHVYRPEGCELCVRRGEPAEDHACRPGDSSLPHRCHGLPKKVATQVIQQGGGDYLLSVKEQQPH